MFIYRENAGFFGLDEVDWRERGVFILRVENDIPAHGSLCLVLGKVDRQNDGKATSEV